MAATLTKPTSTLIISPLGINELLRFKQKVFGFFIKRGNDSQQCAITQVTEQPETSKTNSLN